MADQTTRREKLQAMLVGNPTDQMLRYMLALEFQKEDNHSESLNLLRSLMNDKVPYVPAFMMAGQQLSGLGRIPEAKHTFQLGIQNAIQQHDDHAAGEMTQFLNALPDSA